MRPVAMWLSVVTFAVGLLAISGELSGGVLASAAGDVLGVIALVSVALITSGWVLRRPMWITHGVAVTGGVWLAVALILATESVTIAGQSVAAGQWWRALGILFPPLVATCWAGIASTSWWIERDDPRGDKAGTTPG